MPAQRDEDTTETVEATARAPSASVALPPPSLSPTVEAEVDLEREMAAMNMPPRGHTQCAASKSGAFALTFISYVLFHACRKAFSAIKGEMNAEQWMQSSLYPRGQQGEMYGLLDTLFMGCYAIGLYIRCVCVVCVMRVCGSAKLY